MMTSADNEPNAPAIRKLPIVAALIALIGLADAAYLTVHHYTAEPVPCSVTGGCETVLTSDFAVIAGVPIAAIGAASYFLAFSLAILAAYGSRISWNLFAVQSTAMAAVSIFLIYVQAYVLGAFCQFCLVSAATSVGLFAVFVASLIAARGRRRLS